jgi:maltooligosyltrehalose trehalohydrolase
LAKAFEQNFVYDGIFSKYRNHIHGRSTGNLSQHRFVGFIPNHDQVGNRATGDRLRDIVGLDRAKIAAALALLSSFVPLLFQGEEWAASSPFHYIADHDDPEMARLVSAGRKREFTAFGWDPDLIPDPEKHETFERSKLNWHEVRDGEHAEMLAWYRALIQLRRSTPSLNNGEPGNVRVWYDQNEAWLSMVRREVTVTCNLGKKGLRVRVPESRRLALSSPSNMRVEDGQVTLPPDSVAIFK